MSGPFRRPPFGAVLIAFLCANGAVVSFALGYPDAQYVLWLGLFLVMEVTAAISREPGDTLSERVWAWIGYRPLRPSRWIRVPIVSVFVAILAAHFATNGAFWWSGGGAVIVTAIPLACVIMYAVMIEGRRKAAHPPLDRVPDPWDYTKGEA